MATRGTLIAVIAALLVPDLAAAGDSSLEVETHGLRSAHGQLLLLLFRGPDGFLDGDRAIAAIQVPLDEAQRGKRLGELEPGAYAVVLCHDENGNDDCDRNWLGIPKEGVGFSNDARPGLTGPPSFEDARVDLAPGERKRLSVEIAY